MHLNKLNTKNCSFLIFSDYLSALQAIHSRKITHPVLPDILIQNEKNKFAFTWVLSHVYTKGNNIVDKAGKDSYSVTC